MIHPDVTVAIPTCVNPAGLKGLMDSIGVSRDEPGRLVICLDGNEGWQRLDRMPTYRQRFSEADRLRLAEVNRSVQDYSFLEGRKIDILRNPENLGPVGAFNRLFDASYMDGYVILLNDDVEVRGNWIGCLETVMQRYPNAVLTGFSNLCVEKRRAFLDLPGVCHMGAAMMLRGVYLRALINARGWVDDPRFRMGKTDIQRMCEPAGHGNDVVCVASPILLDHHEHTSLGDWVRDAFMADNVLDIEYPTVNNGAAGLRHRIGRYGHVRMTLTGEILEDTFRVPHYERAEGR